MVIEIILWAIMFWGVVEIIKDEVVYSEEDLISKVEGYKDLEGNYQEVVKELEKDKIYYKDYLFVGDKGEILGEDLEVVEEQLEDFWKERKVKVNVIEEERQYVLEFIRTVGYQEELI